MIRARDNPFAADRVLAVRYRPRGWAWDDLLVRLGELNHRAAIVGPEGSGKTTLLEDLAGRLPALGLVPRLLTLTRDRPHFDDKILAEFLRALTHRDVLLVDGAEQIGRVAWRRLLRRSSHLGGLVITSHRSGLLPTLVGCDTDVALLREIVRALLPAGPAAAVPVQALFDRHEGNVREALREMYDVYAS